MLTEEQVRDYNGRGFIAPLDAFNDDDAAQLRHQFHEFESHLGGVGSLAGTPFQFRPHLLTPWAAELVRHPRILDAVEALIGPDILVYHLTIWIKEPRAESYVTWHQDSTYFGLRPFEHVTAWLALTDADEAMGCMRMIPGSHQKGELTLSEIRADSNLLLRAGQSVRVDENETPAEPTPLRAGQFSLHHTLTLHSSGPNGSDKRRIGFGISYIPTRCRCIAKQRVNATLVRGTDSFGHFDLEARPATSFDDAGKAQHVQSLQRWNAMREQTTAMVRAQMASNGSKTSK